MDRYILFGDANSPHLWKWYQSLILKYDVHVVTFRKQSSFSYSKCTVLLGGRLGLSHAPGFIFNLISFLVLVCKEKPKILNSHYVSSYGLVSSIASIFFDFKYVLSSWGSDILLFPNKSFFHKYLIKFTLSQAEIVTSDSANMSEKINEICDCHVLTFPMGISVKDFSSSNIKSSTFTFLSLRTLIDNSNVDMIILAFSKLHLKYNCELIVANDGDLKEQLIKLSNELNLGGKVKFVGMVKHKKLLNLIRESHVYITVPTSDALSVTLMEAMANEVSIICSKLPSNYEVLDDDRAFFVDYSVDSIVSAMELAILNSESRKLDIYERNKRYLIHNCLWEENIAKLYNELEKI